eukprot:3186859-Prymnesium_polylepis.1
MGRKRQPVAWVWVGSLRCGIPRGRQGDRGGGRPSESRGSERAEEGGRGPGWGCSVWVDEVTGGGGPFRGSHVGGGSGRGAIWAEGRPGRNLGGGSAGAQFGRRFGCRRRAWS